MTSQTGRQRREMLRGWTAHDTDTYQAFAADAIRLTKQPLNRLRILDMGCGSNAPMTVCLAAAGAQVVGVDANPGHLWGLGFRPSRYLAFAKDVGWVRTLRKIAGKFVYDRLYFSHLARCTGLPLRDHGLDLRHMDIQRLDLPAGSFDVVHPNATWEHIADVPAAIRTVAHVLRPSGHRLHQDPFVPVALGRTRPALDRAGDCPAGRRGPVAASAQSWCATTSS
jgi:SAM-dependent methyltransferase